MYCWISSLICSLSNFFSLSNTSSEWNSWSMAYFSSSLIDMKFTLIFSFFYRSLAFSLCPFSSSSSWSIFLCKRHSCSLHRQLCLSRSFTNWEKIYLWFEIRSQYRSVCDCIRLQLTRDSLYERAKTFEGLAIVGSLRDDGGHWAFIEI